MWNVSATPEHGCVAQRSGVALSISGNPLSAESMHAAFLAPYVTVLFPVTPTFTPTPTPMTNADLGEHHGCPRTRPLGRIFSDIMARISTSVAELTPLSSFGGATSCTRGLVRVVLFGNGLYAICALARVVIPMRSTGPGRDLVPHRGFRPRARPACSST